MLMNTINGLQPMQNQFAPGVAGSPQLMQAPGLPQAPQPPPALMQPAPLPGMGDGGGQQPGGMQNISDQHKGQGSQFMMDLIKQFMTMGG